MTAEMDSLETSLITQTGNALLVPARAPPASTPLLPVSRATVSPTFTLERASQSALNLLLSLMMLIEPVMRAILTAPPALPILLPAPRALTLYFSTPRKKIVLLIAPL
jgi:hypothetical protein